MKARLIQNIEEALAEKAEVSTKLFIGEVERLKEKYNSEWISDYMTKDEQKNINRLKESADKWNMAYDQFIDNEFY